MGPDQPFYGLQPVGLDGVTEPLDTIPAMASRYIEELRRVQPEGPYRLMGFCFGGTIVNMLAVRLPDLAAGVPFYGRQVSAQDAAKIKAPLLIHYAEHDERINAGRAEHEAALKANGVRHEVHVYPGTNHGFHNDTTPRYDEAAAKLAWSRTLAFFKEHLRS